MAFDMGVGELRENCDICNLTKAEDMLMMSCRTRKETSIIFVHVSCLSKKLKKHGYVIRVLADDGV